MVMMTGSGSSDHGEEGGGDDDVKIRIRPIMVRTVSRAFATAHFPL